MDSWSVKDRAMVAIGFRLIAGDKQLASADYFVAYREQFGFHTPGEVVDAVDQLVKEGFLESSQTMGREEGWNLEHHLVTGMTSAGQQYFNDVVAKRD
ncbi:hypothetical protein [Pseudomonas syringae]|uniref:hypothetical protein n=1 Tax=Pseudomonas syringae TaxID=317 RepID=UPI0015D35AC9|nr:hypothetical protein [Pseudomonas syringae]